MSGSMLRLCDSFPGECAYVRPTSNYKITLTFMHANVNYCSFSQFFLETAFGSGVMIELITERKILLQRHPSPFD